MTCPLCGGTGEGVVEGIRVECARCHGRGTMEQAEGCLPVGYGLDSLLTVEQFAKWTEMAPSTVREKIRSGAIPATRERRCPRIIHPRTYLASQGGSFKAAVAGGAS